MRPSCIRQAVARSVISLPIISQTNGCRGLAGRGQSVRLADVHRGLRTQGRDRGGQQENAREAAGRVRLRGCIFLLVNYDKIMNAFHISNLSAEKNINYYEKICLILSKTSISYNFKTKEYNSMYFIDFVTKVSLPSNNKVMFY